MKAIMKARVAAAAVALAFGGVAAAGGAEAGAASGAVAVGSSGGAAAPGSQLWVSRYATPGADMPSAMAVSPDGTKVFATGVSPGPKGRANYTTIAYGAATGNQLWIKRFGGKATAIAVSPSGSMVFVTGQSYRGSNIDYGTVAYDAVTGAQRWAAFYDGTGHRMDRALAVAASPAGDAVFVTGSSRNSTKHDDYATVAYDAATGAQLWARRFSGPGDSYARSVAASPTGSAVYVTGQSETAKAGGLNYVTIAYSAASGTQLWLRRYAGLYGHSVGRGVAVSPGGETVYVTGTSWGLGGNATGADYATVAYNAAIGVQRWVKRYNGPADDYDVATALGVDPVTGQVFVTGYTEGLAPGVDQDYSTVAYSPTGVQQWVKRYNGPASDYDVAWALAVSPAAGQVFVTGASDGGPLTEGDDYATVAYDTATGAQLWVRRYQGPAYGIDWATAAAVNDQLGIVYVTGRSSGGVSTGYDYATVAYRIGTGAQK